MIHHCPQHKYSTCRNTSIIIKEPPSVSRRPFWRRSYRMHTSQDSNFNHVNDIIAYHQISRRLFWRRSYGTHLTKNCNCERKRSNSEIKRAHCKIKKRGSRFGKNEAALPLRSAEHEAQLSVTRGHAVFEPGFAVHCGLSQNSTWSWDSTR